MPRVTHTQPAYVAHKHTHTHTYTHTRARTHKHTHARTHIHTHTHTRMAIRQQYREVVDLRPRVMLTMSFRKIEC